MLDAVTPKEPMSESSRPQLRADGDATRTALLDAATELFAEHGYAGAGVRAITTAGGTNVSSVKYYFGDKAGLYVACVEAACDALLAVRPLPSDGCGHSPEEELCALLRWGLDTAAEVQRGGAAAHRLIQRVSQTRGDGDVLVPGLRALAQKTIAPMVKTIGELLALRHPEAAPSSVARATSFIVLMTQKVSEGSVLEDVAMAIPEDDDARAALAEDLCRFVLAGADELLAA